MKGFFYDTVESTNDVGYWLFTRGISSPFFVTAQRQTRGRGQFGRVWYSDDRGNLYISFVFQPSVSPENFQNFSVRVADALAKKLSQELKINLRVKFPNDIYFGVCKIGGILTESKIAEHQIRVAITGIGLNVSGNLSSFPGDLKNTATTLSVCAGEPVSMSRVRSWVVEIMEQLIREISDKSCQIK